MSTIRRTPNSSSPTCLPFAPAERTVVTTASCSSAVGEVGRRRPATRRRVRDERRRPCRPPRSRRRPWPARPCCRPRPSCRSERAAAPASPRRTPTTPNRSRPSCGLVLEGAAAPERAGQLAQGLGGRASQHQDDAPFLADSSASRSARKRSTTRVLRSSSSRLSPTMRPASVVASVPTSLRSEVSGCLPLGGDLRLRVLLDPVGLDDRGVTRLGDDLAPLLAGLLADAGGLLASVGELRLVLLLGALRLGLGLVELRELRADRLLTRVIAPLIGGMTYFVSRKNSSRNAASSTKKVPLGTRKLLRLLLLSPAAASTTGASDAVNAMISWRRGRRRTGP